MRLLRGVRVGRLLLGLGVVLLSDLATACGGRVGGRAGAAGGGKAGGVAIDDGIADRGSAGPGSSGQSGTTEGQGIGEDGKASGTESSAGRGGGSGDQPAGMLCTDAACGGVLAGSWTVVGACLGVEGKADLDRWGLGCPSAPVQGSLAVTGNFSVSDSGVLVDDTETSGDLEFDLAPSCLMISGVPVACEKVAALFPAVGLHSATCQAVGSSCRCRAAYEGAGSMGLVSMFPITAGTARVDTSNTFVTSDGTADAVPESYSYCSKNDMLWVTPHGGARGTITGAIALDRR